MSDLCVAARALDFDDDLLRATVAVRLAMVSYLTTDFRAGIQTLRVALVDIDASFHRHTSFSLHRPVTAADLDALRHLAFSVQTTHDLRPPQIDRWGANGRHGEGVYGLGARTDSLVAMLANVHAEAVHLLFCCEIAHAIALQRDLANRVARKRAARKAGSRKHAARGKSVSGADGGDAESAATDVDVVAIKSIEARLLLECGANKAWEALLCLAATEFVQEEQLLSSYFDRAVVLLREAEAQETAQLATVVADRTKANREEVLRSKSRGAASTEGQALAIPRVVGRSATAITVQVL